MAVLYSKISRKLLLSLINLWGLASFWELGETQFLKISIICLAIVAFAFIWLEISPLFLLIFLSFLTAYAFYGFLYRFNLPVWLVMVGIMIIFGYLQLYTEQKIGILGNKRLIYLLLFSIILLEIFLTLSFYLISPLSKSLIVAITSYLFVGFSYTILAKHNDSKFITYVLTALIVVLLVFLSSPWGGGI